MKDDIDKIKAQLAAETERARWWEKRAKTAIDAEQYYQQQLVDAHTLLGRVIHQLGERWDRVNLTKYFPTDNPFHKRTIDNPTGEEE
jgi:hypothetical protein